MFFESEYLNKHKYIIGVDEVGRGPLAGPVNACSLMVERKQDIEHLLQYLLDLGVTDSKKLSVKKRIKILSDLKINLSSITVNSIYEIETTFNSKMSFVVTEHSPKEIDEVNILNASLSCMKNGIHYLGRDIDVCALIDGNKLPIGLNKNVHAHSVVKGDSKSALIGLASIIAKEFRDQLMVKLARKYPGYGLESHAGYPTKAHKEAVAKLGVTPIHRRTFKGVKEYI